MSKFKKMLMYTGEIYLVNTVMKLLTIEENNTRIHENQQLNHLLIHSVYIQNIGLIHGIVQEVYIIIK